MFGNRRLRELELMSSLSIAQDSTNRTGKVPLVSIICAIPRAQRSARRLLRPGPGDHSMSRCRT